MAGTVEDMGSPHPTSFLQEVDRHDRTWQAWTATWHGLEGTPWTCVHFKTFHFVAAWYLVGFGVCDAHGVSRAHFVPYLQQRTRAAASRLLAAVCM